MSNTLLEQRKEVYEGMKNIMSLKTRTADDIGKYDELEAKYTELTKQVEAEVRFDAVRKAAEAVTEKRMVTSGGKDHDEEHRSAFIKYVRTGNESELRALSEYSIVGGGANVPTLLYNQITTLLPKLCATRRIPGIKVIPTYSTLDIPVTTGFPTATWTAEAPSASYSGSDVPFSKTTLHAYKLGAMQLVSDELLSDAQTDLESALSFGFAQSFANAEEAAFQIGTGTGQPTGIWAVSNIGSSTATGSISGSQITDALFALQYAVGPEYRANGVYVLGDAMAQKARTAKDNIGQYLWVPSTIAGQPDTFAGKQVLVSSQLPTSWTTGTMGGFVDGQFVTIGDRLPYNMLRLNERYADQGQVGFRCTLRTDIAVTNVNALAKFIIN
jgi:HK97 family phage major capsid protein